MRFFPRTALVLSSILLGGLSSLPAFAFPVTILDPSFETQTPADGGWVSDPTRGPYVTTINAWDQSGSTGIFQPTAVPYPAGLPAGNGVNVAWINSGSISQTLGAVVLADHTYTLSVDIGQRADTSDISYQVELLAGGVVIASDTDGVNPLSGEWATSVVAFTPTAGDAAIGAALGIRLTRLDGLQVNFDNILLDAAPPPVPIANTMLLFSLGLLGIGFFSREKQGSYSASILNFHRVRSNHTADSKHTICA